VNFRKLLEYELSRSDVKFPSNCSANSDKRSVTRMHTSALTVCVAEYTVHGKQAVKLITACTNSSYISYRAVHTGNNLPADSTDFSNLRSFKLRLNSSFLARHSAVYYF